MSATVAQQAASFDAASIKPSQGAGRGMNNRRDPVRATWTNMPLAVIIREAYGLKPDQLVGGPNWINDIRFDIVANSEKPASRDKQLRMLQTLLADRFKLSVHWETMIRPQYELLLAKSGPKLPESHAVHRDARSEGTRIARGLIEAHAISMPELAFWLRGELGRPVIDSTGLKGRYEIKLEWEPDESQPNSEGQASRPDAPLPSIFAAIQQFGLRLRATKGPVQVLVIDRVEKPSAN